MNKFILIAVCIVMSSCSSLKKEDGFSYIKPATNRVATQFLNSYKKPDKGDLIKRINILSGAFVRVSEIGVTSEDFKFLIEKHLGDYNDLKPFIDSLCSLYNGYISDTANNENKTQRVLIEIAKGLESATTNGGFSK